MGTPGLPGVFYFGARCSPGERVKLRMRSPKLPERTGTGQTQDAQRRPFDASELDRLPQPNSSDPPYRPFWVNEDKAQDG